jgi:hypothetical protein
VYVCLCMSMHEYVCMCVFMHEYVCMCVCVCLCMSMCVCVCLCMSMYVKPSIDRKVAYVADWTSFQRGSVSLEEQAVPRYWVHEDCVFWRKRRWCVHVCV